MSVASTRLRPADVRLGWIVAALVLFPTLGAAASLVVLIAPHAGLSWALFAGAGYAALASSVAPAVLRFDEKRVREASGRFVRGFEDAAIGMAILTRELTVVRLNATLCQMLGRPPEEVVGRSILSFTHPDDVQRSVAKIDSTIRGDEAPLVKRYLRPDGTTVEAMITSVFVEPERSEPYFFSQLQDVTEQRRAERQKAAIADLGRLALGSDARALMSEATRLVREILDAETCVILRRAGDAELRLAAASPADVNPQLTVPLRASQTGYTLETGQPVRSNDLAEETRFAVPEVVLARGLRRALSVQVPERTGARHVLIVHTAGGGRAFATEDERFLEAVANVLGSALDHAATEDELRRRALEDPLTGLANRALLMSQLERELRHGARLGTKLCVLVLDLDRFKVVNDSLGHNVGDALLRQVAARLASSVREEDLVARPGGDEFVIVSARTDSDRSVAEIGQRIVDCFAEPFRIAGRELSCAASIGIAVVETGLEKPDELVRDADAAMYRAKELGGGHFEIFDLALRDRLVERLAVEDDLRHAVERNELDLYYQPLVDLDSEQIVGLEALVRWRHPVRGLLAPADFIPIAEETGLIVPVGAWVLRTACSQASTWPEGWHVSVNLSPVQVVPALVAEVAELLDRHGLAPERLVLEITESLVLDPRTKPVVSGLRGLGVHVALDDFGTGYSSLGSLQRFPMDVVKLDRALVASVDDGSGRAILHAAVELGHALGMRVVAEGIENQSQLDRLRDLGCPVGQGYLFARPLPYDEAQRLVTAGTGP